MRRKEKKRKETTSSSPITYFYAFLHSYVILFDQ